MSSSVECLRGLIKQRLTAAAEDIFTVCLKTIVEYQKEIDHQRRLLEAVLTPGVKLHAADLPQQHVYKEEEVLTDQEKNSSLDQDDPDPPLIKEEQEELYTSLDQEDPDPPLIKEEQEELYTSLDQEDPDPPQIKEEQEELCTSMEREQLVLKQETDTFMLITTCETSDNSEDETLDLDPDETQVAAEIEDIVVVSVKGSKEPDRNSDKQLLCHNSNVAESQDHKGDKHRDSELNSNANTNLKRSHKSPNSKEENAATLNIHSSTSTDTECFKCDTCGKTFEKEFWLQRHQRVHSEERPCQCNICGKRFLWLCNLKNHMRVHSGERPYQCTTCEKTFSQVSNLKNHMRVHTGEKPFQCNTCEKTFSQASNLKKHLRIHTGEKPYQCNTCEKRFSQVNTLNEHLRVHTKRSHTTVTL